MRKGFSPGSLGPTGRHLLDKSDAGRAVCTHPVRLPQSLLLPERQAALLGISNFFAFSNIQLLCIHMTFVASQLPLGPPPNWYWRVPRFAMARRFRRERP